MDNISTQAMSSDVLSDDKLSVGKDITDICEVGPGGGAGLNAGAEAWSPEIGRAPEEKLCLYLTFSKGYPISANQLVHFFTRRFGPCVERVYVHAPPLFGKIHFSASYVPALILNGEDEVRLTIDGRYVSCKRFAENRRKNRTSAPVLLPAGVQTN
ncbi:hypothetical protein LINGRAHAP2_LOCUS9197 [Linum grandiflorum]